MDDDRRLANPAILETVEGVRIRLPFGVESLPSKVCRSSCLDSASSR